MIQITQQATFNELFLYKVNRSCVVESKCSIVGTVTFSSDIIATLLVNATLNTDRNIQHAVGCRYKTLGMGTWVSVFSVSANPPPPRVCLTSLPL